MNTYIVRVSTKRGPKKVLVIANTPTEAFGQAEQFCLDMNYEEVNARGCDVHDEDCGEYFVNQHHNSTS